LFSRLDKRTATNSEKMIFSELETDQQFLLTVTEVKK